MCFWWEKNEFVVIFQIWRHYDVIFTIFSSEIIKSSIQIVWKWLIPLFNMFSVKKTKFCYFLNLTSLWRPFQKLSNQIKFTNIFNVKFAEEFENIISFILKCVFDALVTSLWRQFYHLYCILHLKSWNPQFKSYEND